MTTNDSTPRAALLFAYRLLVLLRTAVAVLVGLATVAATLGWV